MDFTIVTPSFRQLDWLELCIASVADQDGVSVEHIVQDGGTEGFGAFAQKMADRWPDQPGYRRIMISEKDAGMYDAVNQGLRKGMAPFCAYLNCDEQYLPGTLGQILRIFKTQPATDIIFGGVLIINPDGSLISARRPVRLYGPHVATCHLPNFTCAMFFRRELLSRQGAWFDSRWRDCADALWVMDRLKNKTTIDRCMDFVTAFADTGHNMNLSPNALEEARKIRGAVPVFWRWLRSFWVLWHWLGKLFDGSYWPRRLTYAIYTFASAGKRTKICGQTANPFWIARWFVRERLALRPR